MPAAQLTLVSMAKRVEIAPLPDGSILYAIFIAAEIVESFTSSTSQLMANGKELCGKNKKNNKKAYSQGYPTTVWTRNTRPKPPPPMSILTR